MDKFIKDANVVRESAGSKRVVRFGDRKPKLNLVFSLEKGPAHAVWSEMGVPLSAHKGDERMNCSVDWLNYDSVPVNSANAASFLSCLMQEPFKNIPLVWTIHEQTLAARLRRYVSSGQGELIDTWRKFFSRATVVVFPNYILPEDGGDVEALKVGAGHVAANTVRLLIAGSQAGGLIGVSGQNIVDLRNTSGASYWSRVFKIVDFAANHLGENYRARPQYVPKYLIRNFVATEHLV